MKVAQFHTSYRHRGGEDAVVDAEAQILRADGHDVRQVIAHNPGRWGPAAASLVVSPWNPQWIRRVGRILDEFQPDVAHVHNTWFAMSPAVIRTMKRAGVPVVMTLHNYRLTCVNGLLYRDGAICEDCVGSSLWDGVRHSCYRNSRVASAFAAATFEVHRRLATFSDLVDLFVVLSGLQRQLMIRAGLPPERIVVKPNFVPDPGPRGAQPSTSNIILYVGRLAPEKGVDLLVEAWEGASMDGFELWIVGDGPDREQLARRGVAGVRFLGELPPEQVTSLMLGSRAGLIPSRWYETFGMVMAEAFACGLPVLTWTGSAVAEGALHLGDDWLVKQPTIESWSSAMGILRNGQATDDGGRAGRALYESRYSQSQAGALLLSAYATAEHRSREREPTI